MSAQSDPHDPHDPHANQPVLSTGAPLATAAGAVILLHGRGASAEDILGLAEAFDEPRLAYLAPQAARNSWYPNSFLAAREQNEPWLSSALLKVKATVALATTAGLPLGRIVVCGFSQGACLSTEFVAGNPARYGALIAYTGGLVGPPAADLHHPGNLAGTPAFLGSGDPDPHVPWKRVEESAAILKQMGAEVTLQRYPNRPHTISQQELAVGKAMVRAMLAKSLTTTAGNRSSLYL